MSRLSDFAMNRPGPTPTPWHVDSADRIRSTAGIVIARCERRERHEYMSASEQTANARLIVRAVNAHADLVAALEHAIDFAERNGGDDAYTFLPMYRAALKTAKGS